MAILEPRQDNRELGSPKSAHSVLAVDKLAWDSIKSAIRGLQETLDFGLYVILANNGAYVTFLESSPAVERNTDDLCWSIVDFTSRDATLGVPTDTSPYNRILTTLQISNVESGYLLDLSVLRTEPLSFDIWLIRGRDDKPFDKKDLSIAKLALSYAQMLIDRSRIESDLVASRKHVQIIEASAREVTSVSDRSEVFLSLVRRSAELLETPMSGLYRYDAQTRTLTLVADSLRRFAGTEIALGEGVAGQIALTGSSFLSVSNYRAWDHRALAYEKESIFGAVLGVPLLWRNELVGVLYVADHEERHFDETDAQLLNSLAGHAALTLEQRLDCQRQDFLLECTEIVAESGVRSDALAAMVRRLKEFLGYSFACVFAETSDDFQLSVTAESGLDNLTCESLGWRKAGIGKWMGFNSLQTCETTTVLKQGVAKDEITLRHLTEQFSLRSELRSALLLPVVSNGISNGVLCLGDVNTIHRWMFQHEGIVIAEGVSKQIGVLLQKLNFYEANEEYRHLLDDLDDLSRDFLTRKSSPQLEQTVARLAVQLFKADFGLVFQNLPDLGALRLVGIYPPDVSAIGMTVAHRDSAVGSGAMADSGTSVSAPVDFDDPLLSSLGIKAVATSALRYEGQLIGVLAIGKKVKSGFSQSSLNILNRFGKRAAIALGSVGESSPEHRMTRHLNLLHSIRDYIQKTNQGLEAVLMVILSAITAGYGLGFNRAVVFLVDEDQLTLSGFLGIGQVNEIDAQRAWERDHLLKLDDLSGHIALIESGEFFTSELSGKIRSVSLPILENSDDAVSRAYYSRTITKVFNRELDSIPKPLFDLMLPTNCVFVIPLIARNRVLGVLVADRKFVEDVDIVEENSLVTFAGVAASAIDIKRLEKFRTLYTASRRLFSEDDPQTAFNLIVEDVPALSGALRVSVYFATSRGELELEYWSPTDSGVESILDFKQIFSEVMQTGIRRTSELWGDRTDNPAISELTKSLSYVCLPLMLEGKATGVILLNFSPLHRFSREELEGLELHANHLAIAYANVQRIKRANNLQIALARVSAPVRLAGVRSQIVESALDLLEAQFAVFWPYDTGTSTFIPQHLATASEGTPLNQLTMELRTHPPAPGHTTSKVIDNQWFSEQTIADKCPDYMQKDVQKTLTKFGIVSFQAGSLRTGEELLGVLYCSYSYERSFANNDKSLLTTFCDFASLAVKRAMLHEQLEATTAAAQDVARRTVLENLPQTLLSVISALRGASACQSIIIYDFDAETNSFGFPPVQVGVRAADLIKRFPEIPDQSIVWTFLRMDEPYIVTDGEKDQYLRDAPFRTREDVISAVIVPLKAGDRRVGVVFVNYTHRHDFRAEEVLNIEFFANQAASAIRQAQLFKHVSIKLQEQKEIADLSHSLLDTLSVSETLDRAVEAASRILHTPFSNLVLEDPNSQQLVFSAAVGWDKALVGTQTLGRGTQSHAGYTIDQNQAVGIDDFDDPTKPVPFSILPLAKRLGIRSALSVPVLQDQKIVGVLLVQQIVVRRWSEAEVSMLQTIADLAALGMKAARQHNTLERRTAHLEALAGAAELLVRPAAKIDRSSVLRQILRGAVGSVTAAQRRNSAIAVLQTYNWEKDEAQIVALETFPSDTASKISIDFQKPRRLRLTSEPSKIGVTGRVILTGRSILLSDVSDSDDYIPMWSETRSEIAVPLFMPNTRSGQDGSVWGAISLETDLLGAFDKEDLKNLEALAKLAEELTHKVELDSKSAGLLKQLQDLDRRKTEWIKFVSHELRTPVAPLQLLIEDQLTGTTGFVPYKTRERLEHNLEMVRQQGHLIDNLLAKMRLDGGFTNLAISDSNVDNVINSVYRTFEHSAKRKRIQFAIKAADPSKLGAQIDARKIEHVISNLVSNALKFTPEFGKVHIMATRQDDFITVRVRDTGRGIPSDSQDRVFELHFQAKRSDSNDGIGLGLSLVKSFVEMHGGQVGFNSQVGIGTEFWFTLPVSVAK